MINDSTLPSPRLVSIDRRQLVLRSVDVERLIDDDHSARLIWELVGRLDLSLYHAQVASVEGRAGREHTAPQLMISLWLYAYSRGISSAREIARQCEYEPGCQWLCGLMPISHRTLSGFRSECKTALDDLFVQVLGMLSAEGLLTLERMTLDGTKIKANAGSNSFRRKEKLEAHLELAREQVRILNAQSEEEEKTSHRQAAARRRAARQRASRLEAAVREVERLQQAKKHDRKEFVARASSTDPDAHVMRNGEGGTVPYTNHASVQAAAACGVDFYGSWQDSWKPLERDAQGRSAGFLASAFPYDARRDCFTCPVGQILTHHAMLNRENGVHTHVYRAPKAACGKCPRRGQCAPQDARPVWRRSITRSEEPATTTTFKAKMATEEAREIYAQRSQIAEFPHAWIKERCGLRQFRCRGRLKVAMEATWACLSYNLTRWFSIRRKFNLETAPA